MTDKKQELIELAYDAFLDSYNTHGDSFNNKKAGVKAIIDLLDIEVVGDDNSGGIDRQSLNDELVRLKRLTYKYKLPKDFDCMGQTLAQCQVFILPKFNQAPKINIDRIKENQNEK